ncbi:hypothetical protein H4Q26_018289 [Puccinia striiformis f. sp. tritici PST-130]|nr:hypothetical protein H4Q26_018289 [Puccinia striiformis f. sp. tritici PST-130]
MQCCTAYMFGIAHHNDHPNVDPPSLNQDNDNQINTDRVNVDPSLANRYYAIIDRLYYLYLVAVPTPVPPLVSVPVLVTSTVAIQEQLTTETSER